MHAIADGLQLLRARNIAHAWRFRSALMELWIRSVQKTPCVKTTCQARKNFRFCGGMVDLDP